jgi:MYXO-CTERM domain-containing protein
MNATKTLLVPLVASFLAAVATPACSVPAPSPAEATGTAREGVIRGKNSPTSQDAVVLIFFFDQSSGMGGACTGTLLAPNLVLTARHCVADTDEYAACDADGTPLAGGEVRSTRKASSLWIFTGPNRPEYRPGLKPDGVGAKIIDDGGKNLCNHDIALIVLEDPIENAQIAPIRLESDIEKSDVLTAVGWGVTDKQSMPDVRQQRSGIKVDAIGPDEDANPPVASNEFQVGESICSGDSGGPALAQTGAIVGVVSRGGNGSGGSQSDPSAGCIGAENLYTKVAPFKDLILQAYDEAGAEPWLEGEPDPRLAKADEECSDDSECRSNLCLTDEAAEGSPTTCAAECADDSECPDGQECTSVSDTMVCRTKKVVKKSGCATAPAGEPANGGTGLLAIALGAVGLVVSRRRRR